MAHTLSLPYPNSRDRKMLRGNRFPFNSNQVYRMDRDQWESIKDNQASIQTVVRWFVKDFYVNQLPRITTLERYYNGDNDIHYWDSDKASDRADNRVISGLPRTITNIRVGYQFGNPIKFGYQNLVDSTDNGDDITQAIELFNSKNDETYHEKMMGKNLNNTGRAYELIYIKKDTNQPAITDIDPATCFVVYDTTIEKHSLFAVRFYMNTFMDKTTYYIEVYTDDSVFYFTAENSPFDIYLFKEQVDHYFMSVPITEYQLNAERMGIWEHKLDEIDAYDKSLSEMSNSQEDFSNSILVINGDVDVQKEPMVDAYGNELLDENGDPILVQKDVKANGRYLFLKPSRVDNDVGGVTIIPSSAEYLTKSLDPNGWEVYTKRLLADIHQDTNTPDVTDENFSSNASGVAMSYKLWGSDQERATQQSLYTRGLMRRMRLLSNYWYLTNQISSPDEIENIEVTYSPNLPKNDSEIVTNLQALANSHEFSAETLHEYAFPVTGITSDQEAQRFKDEQKTAMQNGLDILDKNNLITDQERLKGGDDSADQSTDTTTDYTTD